ncbi:ATP synthase subunit 6 (mitochondrion)-like, partial [Tropilaelaps mercedesae]
LIIFNLLLKFNNFIKHLVPLGTPIILSSFIVIIETLRNLIRPSILAIRLTANIIAGHLEQQQFSMKEISSFVVDYSVQPEWRAQWICCFLIL